jgi:hypothetical protein
MTGRTVTRQAEVWASLYGTTRRGRFVRERLPNPAKYFESEGIALRGCGTWRDAVCPFHDDTTPSLRVHAETGAYRCMACGARGGDVLSFHRRRHGLGFVAAAEALGAWEGGA